MILISHDLNIIFTHFSFSKETLVKALLHGRYEQWNVTLGWATRLSYLPFWTSFCLDLFMKTLQLLSLYILQYNHP